MSSSMLYKFSDLAEEEKWWIAYNTIVDYIDDILSNPLGEQHNKQFKTNKIFKKLLYILNNLNIFNKTIRHIDWKKSQRSVDATIRIAKNIEKKYNNIYKKDITIEQRKINRCSIYYLMID